MRTPIPLAFSAASTSRSDNSYLSPSLPSASSLKCVRKAMNSTSAVILGGAPSLLQVLQQPDCMQQPPDEASASFTDAPCQPSAVNGLPSDMISPAGICSSA